MIVPKRHLTVLVMTCVIGVTASCAKSYQPAADTLVVAIEEQPLTLDPRFATDATGIRIASLIFSGFIRVGDNFELFPDAAERWEVHGHTCTFFLRKDLTFHNGRKVSVDDILFTWEFYRGPKSPFASGLFAIQTVAVQEHDGQIRMDILLKKSSESFLLGQLPSIKILPKKEIMAAGEDFNQILIGSGPFQFSGQDLTTIRLKAVPGQAKIHNLVFKIIRDDFTRYQKMLKGEVDIAQNVLPQERVGDFQKRSEQFNVVTYPGLNMVYLLLNFKDEYLKQKAMRHGLAQAIDRAAILKYKLKGLATEATSILTPNNPYHNSQIKNPPFDIGAAIAQIKNLHITNKTFVLKTANSPSSIDNGRILANQFQQAGVDVNHESLEWATYYDGVKKGNFQLALMKWVGTVDPDIYRDAFHSKETPPGRNRGSYQNAEVDRLLDQGVAAETRDQRKKIFDRVQMLVHSDLAILPLWYDLQIAVSRREVLDYKPTMTSDYWTFTQVSKRR